MALIGELAKRVSEPIRAAIGIPWREIAGFRDRAIHDYYQSDFQIAWGAILHDLDPLTGALKTFLGGFFSPSFPCHPQPPLSKS